MTLSVRVYTKRGVDERTAKAGSALVNFLAEYPEMFAIGPIANGGNMIDFAKPVRGSDPGNIAPMRILIGTEATPRPRQ